VANSWKKSWQCVEHTINAKLGTEFEKKNKTLEEIVDKLKNTQLKNQEETVTFFLE
jgi:exonuclease VII small subunit